MKTKLLAAATTTLLSCGSRTDLDVVQSSDGAGQTLDASLVDASPRTDASSHLDAGANEAGRCNDGGPLAVSYLFDGSGILYRYDPRTGEVTTLGSPACGDDNGLWTMTVGATNAFIVFQDWSISTVDLATAACSPTLFQFGDLSIGVEYGVAASETDGERLFVYGQQSSTGETVLAVGDTVSFDLTLVGDVLPVPPAMSFPPNLTADGLGHILAYSPDGLLQVIDAASGAVVRSSNTGLVSTSTWASLVYGSDVYLFADTTVAGFDIATGEMTSPPRTIDVAPIGAGSVLLCAGE